MKIVCIGGGPAGLYFGLLMKLQDPANEVTVIERNRPYDTFGWGVVFSDATMQNLREADPVSAQTIGDAFNHWDDIDIHFKGRSLRSGGHGFIGIGRKKLLNILQARCEVGVKLVFEQFIQDDQAIAREYDADLVIASDGINSQVRTRYADTFRPDIDQRNCRFVWLGTKKVFDAFTFAFVQTEHGWFQAHAYRYEDGMSTFIVETPEETWQAAGIEQMSQEEGIAYCEKLFAPWLDGNPLVSNASHLRGSAIWIRFPRVICNTWVHWNTLDTARGERRVPVVLMGDAAHTAHFSIGSGTKLALEDSIELARCLSGAEGSVEHGLKHYEEVRSVEVLKIQNAARNSTEWFENVKRYAGLEPEQFAYSLLTRSQRISHENLRLRDPAWLEGFERWIAERAGAPAPAGQRPAMPMLTPYQARGVRLKNRIMVSPMAMYSCQDGVPGDFHLVHLGGRAMGGAGLVMVEMTCVSPDARITPGCPGLWNDEQARAFTRIVDFVHGNSDARIGVQIGHAGRRARPSWAGRRSTIRWPKATGRCCRPGAALYRGRVADAARHDARRHGSGARQLRGRHQAGRGRRFRLAGAALRPRLSAVQLHLAPDQPARRRIRRQPGEPAALSAGSVPRGARRLARGQAHVGADLGARLGRGRHHPDDAVEIARRFRPPAPT